MDIKIKRADVSDSNALYFLSKKLYDTDCADEDLIVDFLRNNKCGITFIAYASGIPAGYVSGGIYREIGCKIIEAEIKVLFVDDAYRRYGVATKLLFELEKIFDNENVSIINIYTSVNNQAAQAFYSSCGYDGKTRMIYRKIKA